MCRYYKFLYCIDTVTDGSEARNMDSSSPTGECDSAECGEVNTESLHTEADLSRMHTNADVRMVFQT